MILPPAETLQPQDEPSNALIYLVCSWAFIAGGVIGGMIGFSLAGGWAL